MVNGNGKPSKKGKAVKHSPAKESNPKKDVRISTLQGHAFRCVPLSVNVIFEKCLKKDPQKHAIVDELGFGSLSYLPNYYLKQKVLMQIFKRFDLYDITIHAVAGEVEITTEKIGKAFGLKYTGEVEITTEKIGKAFGLKYTGTTYAERVTIKDLSEEDECIFKFFQGKSQAALKDLIFNKPVDTEENRNKFKRAFLLYIQKCFLLPTSAPNVTRRALPTIFDLENTRNKNWALHRHNFLLEEKEKAKKNCRDAEAQPQWVQYWMGKTLWDRMKQEKTMAAVTSWAHDCSGSVFGSEEEESAKQPDEVPPVDSATASLGDNESNARRGNLFVEADEQYHEQPQHKPLQEEEPPQQQPQPQLPHQVLVPKAEPDLVSSPTERLLTDALMKMSKDEQPPPQEEENDPAQNQEQQQ
ncbi:hypothetical protein PIB30_040809 [Stylosanthes scabra]|uniref:Uncharacterized protein n=1 Tax=Stylosanthes scabra TaxID=79078 RepID=A0ABU6TEE6_9FABA|nr:hypothetical protein [Stylosanthes scabra]